MAFGVLALLNRILVNFARLWQTLQYLSQVAEGGRLHPHRFDANIMRSLKPGHSQYLPEAGGPIPQLVGRARNARHGEVPQ